MKFTPYGFALVDLLPVLVVTLMFFVGLLWLGHFVTTLFGPDEDDEDDFPPPE